MLEEMLIEYFNYGAKFEEARKKLHEEYVVIQKQQAELYKKLVDYLQQLHQGVIIEIADKSYYIFVDRNLQIQFRSCVSVKEAAKILMLEKMTGRKERES